MGLQLGTVSTTSEAGLLYSIRSLMCNMLPVALAGASAAERPSTPTSACITRQGKQGPQHRRYRRHCWGRWWWCSDYSDHSRDHCPLTRQGCRARRARGPPAHRRRPQLPPLGPQPRGGHARPQTVGRPPPWQRTTTSGGGDWGIRRRLPCCPQAQQRKQPLAICSPRWRGRHTCLPAQCRPCRW